MMGMPALDGAVIVGGATTAMAEGAIRYGNPSTIG
jgi:hypothetical protein